MMMLVPVAVAAQSGTRSTLVIVLSVSGLFAGAHAAAQAQGAPRGHLAHWVGTERHMPVRVRMTVRSNHQGWITGNAHAVWEDGLWRSCHGLVSGTVPYGVQGGEGDLIDIMGRLRIRWRRGVPTLRIAVQAREHATVVRPLNGLQGLLRTVRTQSSAALTDDPIVQPVIQELVRSMVLGKRGARWREVIAPFRSTGTAHLLAISGLHLAMFCGLALMIWRSLIGGPQSGIVVIAIVAIALMLIADVRTPLARAGLMTVTACTLALVRWRLSGRSLLAIAAIAVQIDDPSACLGPSFQLSFLVVASFLYILPRWEHRVTIPGLRTPRWPRAIRAAILAWCVATPISVYWFGHFSPLGVPATLLLAPLVGLMLGFGYGRIGLGWIPGVDWLLGELLNSTASVMWWLVVWISRIPAADIRTPSPAWWWVVSMEFMAVTMFIDSRRLVRVVLALMFLASWIVISTIFT